MLINTVILFIKDLLPIFILLCLVSCHIKLSELSINRLLFIFLSSVLGIMATFYFLPTMAELFEGAGIELLKTVELILVYFCLLFGCSFLITQDKISAHNRHLLTVGIIVFIVVNASQFIVFLDSYVASSQTVREVLAGLSIGLGICLSFSALLYFSLLWMIAKEHFILIYLMLALFLTGQITQVVSLLQQVDIIQSSEVFWDSSDWIQNSSEYGHLFKTLFGYEAKPSEEFILLYIISLLIFSGYYFTLLILKRYQQYDIAKET
ncbi:hypothetical protein AADZ91_00950 [Colwelliaceae bacterium 6441]